ncbi:MAG: FAD/NAD(P)-binding protein [Rhodospirillaceae bacterium]|nr:FAD/NAD(P)-binding protein [Rhodospirillaceae bacterium]
MDIAAPTIRPPSGDPMLPRLFRIERVKKELSDTFTMEITPADGGPFHFRPGQFNMLSAFGVGEVPISISGDPGDSEMLVHTTRVVGSVTAAICALKPGDTVGVRGPFGSHWPVEDARGADVVFVAGGIGLAPLRPAIYQIMADREHYGNVVIFYGSRTPEDLLYRRELQRWRGRFDMSTEIIVDRATGHWGGRVGVVTKLIRGGGFDRHHSIAFVCGPEVMMRFAVQTLGECGVTGDRVFLSMERNMKCALGFCGHCQFGPTFVCRDGPVYRYDAIERLFNVWEV